ncbi:hypothetical protein CEP54_010145 [Fusarium duplospermum]|uniref:Uncharacterized protein n=1 Tax=Fusarium duplospermum TaxID=1325734 RepID=A0A428PLN8_9HYPO|nr:hypothetical protein CEP54_010145 [Fusarium duplospermum]
MSVLRPLRSFRRRIRRPTSPCVQELRPQVADEERRPSVIRRLFTRKKTMAVEENLAPVVSEPVFSEPEVFNRSLSIGRSASAKYPPSYYVLSNLRLGKVDLERNPQQRSH